MISLVLYTYYNCNDDYHNNDITTNMSSARTINNEITNGNDNNNE